MASADDFEERTEPVRPSFFWLVYGQISAILGAFSLLVFTSQFLSADGVAVLFKGFVRDAYLFWNDMVRPAFGVAFDGYEQVSGQKLSPLFRDYLTVGVVTLLSYLRAVLGENVRAASPLNVAILVLDMIANIVLWPVIMLKAVLEIWRDDPSRALRTSAMVLTPLAYLALLYAASAWLL